MNEVHELMAFLQTRLSEAGSSQGLGGSRDLLDPVSSAALKQWLQVWASSSAADREQAIEPDCATEVLAQNLHGQRLMSFHPCACPLSVYQADVKQVGPTPAMPEHASAAYVCWSCFRNVQELRDAAGHMTSERTQQLMLFQTSERYLARVAAALQHKAGQEAKFRRCAEWQLRSCACLQLEAAFGNAAER